MDELTSMDRQILIAVMDSYMKQLVGKLIPKPEKKEEPKNEKTDSKPVAN